MDHGQHVARTDAEPSTPAVGMTVMVVDDHRVFADVLCSRLERESDVADVAVAHSAHEATARVSTARFDVVIADLDLPDSCGLGLVAGLRALRPDVRIVVLTAYARADLVARCTTAGADAVLAKEGTLDGVLAALRGGTPPEGLPAAVDDGAVVDLTYRERDVLRLLGQGLDPSRIAGHLGISLHTVRGHVKTINAKMGARSQLEAVVAAHRRGLISIGSRY